MFTEDYSGPSVKGFKSFAESKDPNEYYHWMDSSICACGQYAKSIGVKDWMFKCREESGWNGASGHDGTWGTLNEIARGGGHQEWTFGRLAQRLKEYA